MFDPSALPDPHRPHGGAEESLFPRELTTDLVSRSENPGPRGRWQLLALALGLVVVALGLPLGRLWAEGAYVGRLEHLHGVDHLPLGLSHRLLDGFLRSEAAAFLLSATGLGAAFLGLVHLFRTVGFDRGIALLSAGILCLSPVTWMGATLPVATAWGLLGSALILAEAFRCERDRRRTRRWLGLLLLLGWWLRPECIFLAPAAAAAGGKSTRVRLWLVGLLLIAASFRELDLGLPGDPRELLPRLAWPLLGIGVGWFGLYSLLRGRRAEEESPPPAWLGVALLGWLAATLLGDLSAGSCVGPLAAVAGLGLADLLQRQEDEASSRGLALVLVALQLTGIAATRWAWESQDPLAPWRAAARQSLQPTDLALTLDRSQAHLLVRRFGVEVLELSPEAEAPSGELDPDLQRRIAAAWSSGRRVVLVLPAEGGSEGRPPASLEALPGLLVLEPDGGLR